MGDLELDPLAADIGPVLAPVELECLAGLKHQGNVGAAPGRLLCPVPIGPPGSGEGRNATVGAVVPELDQISVHLGHGPPLFARLPRLRKQPG